MKETDNIYPDEEGQTFIIKLNDSFEKDRDIFLEGGDFKLRVVNVPKLTIWSKIKKFFGFKNLTYVNNCEKR